MSREEHVLLSGLPWRSKSLSDEALENISTSILSYEYSHCGSDQSEKKKDFMVSMKRLRIFIKMKGYIDPQRHSSLLNHLLRVLLQTGSVLIEQEKMLSTLQLLLNSKRKGVSVSVDWKDFWQLIEKLILRDRESDDLCSNNEISGHLVRIANVCHLLRLYYSETIIPEVTATAYEYMKDHSSRDMFIGLAILQFFLPSCPTDRYYKDGHLDTWINIWSKVNHGRDWNCRWLYIFSRAFKWGGAPAPFIERHMSWLQTGILNVLAVSTTIDRKVARINSYKFVSALVGPLSEGRCAAKLSAYLIGFGSAGSFYSAHVPLPICASNSIEEELNLCEKKDIALSRGLLHVRWLLASTRTLFHPSNVGILTVQMMEYTLQLVSSFAKRLGRERAARQGICPFGSIPSSNFLTVADKREFVKQLLPLLTMAVYSKQRRISHAAERCLNQLAFIAPISVYKHIVPLIIDALDPANLNQTHQAPAAINILTILLQPLLQAKPLLAEDLPYLLELTLPGIDSNDPIKTMKTTTLYQVVLSWVPIISVEELEFPSDATFETHALSLSKSYNIDNDEMEEQYPGDNHFREMMWRGSLCLVEWSLECLDRILRFIENQIASAKKGLAAQFDNAVNDSVLLTSRLLLSQMSEEVLLKASTRIVSWCLRSCKLDAIRGAKRFIKSYTITMWSMSQSSISRDDSIFWKHVMDGLFSTLLGDAMDDSTSDTRLEWSIVMLGAISRFAGSHLVPFEKKMIALIELRLSHDKTRIRKATAKLLRQLLRGLSEIFIPCWSSNSKIIGKNRSDLAVAAISWAQPLRWRDVCESAAWSKVDPTSLAMAKRLGDYFTNRTLSTLESLPEINNSENDCVNEVFSNGSRKLRDELQLLHYIVRGTSAFCVERRPRMQLMTRVAKLLSRLLELKEADTVSHRRAINVMKALMICFGAATSSADKLNRREVWFRYIRELVGTSKAYSAELRALANNFEVPDRSDYVASRFNQVDDVQTLFLWQRHLQSIDMLQEGKDLGDEEALSFCFQVAKKANEHDWADTRKSARGFIRTVLRRAPWLGKMQIRKILEELSSNSSSTPFSYGRIVGTWSLLSDRQVKKWISSDWDLRSSFFKGGLLVDFDSIINHLPQDKRKLCTDEMQRTLVFVLSHWYRLPELCSRHVSLRDNLMSELVKSNIHDRMGWRQQQVVCVLLSTLVRDDTDPAINMDIIQWVANRVVAEIQPLRYTALNSLVKILRKTSPELLSSILTRLDLCGKDANLHMENEESGFLRSVVNSLSQSHRSAHLSADGSVSVGKSKSEWSTGVENFMKLSEFTGANWNPKNSSYPMYSGAFKSSNKLVIEWLCTVLGVKDCMAAFVPQLEYLVCQDTHTAEHRSKVTAAAEILSGLAAACKRDCTPLNPSILKLVEDNIFSSSDLVMKQWIDAIRCSENVDLCFELANFAKTRLQLTLLSNGENVSEAVLSKNLLFVLYVSIVEIPTGWNENTGELAREALKLLSGSLAHPFADVRAAVGRAWSMIASALLRNNVPMAADTILELVSKMLERVRKQPQPVKESCEPSYIVDTVMCLSFFVIDLASSQLVDLVLPKFTRVILESQGHPNLDVNKNAKSIAKIFCDSKVSNEETALMILSEIIDAKKNANQDDMWYTRRAVACILAEFVASYAPVFGHNCHIQLAIKEIEELLDDSRDEVHKTASFVLTMVFSTFVEDSPILIESKNRYLKYAMIKVRSREYRTDEGKKRLRKKLTGVLGLTSIIHAFPYTVPFPDAVVAVARCTTAPHPTNKFAKESISSFRHTHTDSWDETKRSFTREELEDIQGTSYSLSHT